MKTKQCPKCGEEFICYNPEPCWCTPIKLTADHLKYLKENFEDCLCKKCLLEISETSIESLKVSEE